MQDSEVLVAREGALGIITLNRPRALNSLTLDMVRIIHAALKEFAADALIGLVLIRGAGERGLCAGGDIRAIHDSGRAGDGESAHFLREEYEMNAAIAVFPKPYVAFMDGIVMGGGVGVSAHGSHRIVTDTTKLAMPEVGIGFVPDVGSTHILSRSPSESGTYLALTGEPVGADDAVYIGLADYVVASVDLPKLQAALGRLGAKASRDDVRAVIAQFTRSAKPGKCEQNKAALAAIFGRSTVEEIVKALSAETSDFAIKTLTAIKRQSPTSLKVALDLLRRARTKNLEECLIAEYRAALATFEGHDFYEGVRAAVIDKDRNPQWSPRDLAAVDDTVVAKHRKPRPNEPFNSGSEQT